MSTVQNGKLFSCGNHASETTKGMLHFGDPSEVVCMIDVPTTMTVRDVIQFLSPSLQDIVNARILREVNQDSAYIVLIRLKNADLALEFYTNYDGMRFNSLEENICKLLYVTRVEFFNEDPTGTLDKEKENCTICFEDIHSDVENIVTILCNHSFHAHCLGKLDDTSCPLCRYSQTPLCQVESKCMTCSYEGESLWMCIVCGFVACGRYVNGHAHDHFVETQHTYAMQLADNQVWDYAGDNYVHRLLANKTDGKPVEVEGVDVHRQAEEKIEAIQLEYTYLLTQQLDSQRKYYDKLLKNNEKQSQKKIKDLVNKSKQLADDLAQLQETYQQALKDKSNNEKKISILQAKIFKLSNELSNESQLNKCLTLNQQQLQNKLKEVELEVASKQKFIEELEEQQKDLMFSLEFRDKVEASVASNSISRTELEDSRIVMPSPASSSHQINSSRQNKRKNKQTK